MRGAAEGTWPDVYYRLLFVVLEAGHLLVVFLQFALLSGATIYEDLRRRNSGHYLIQTTTAATYIYVF